ncbi:hypothetical protein ACFL6T_07115 [Candidatus Zixiibacteriota bacterium]
MGRVATMRALRYRSHARSTLSFGCRYTQRTLGQLGKDALQLPLVARHLLLCPACRAHRRRVTRVDEALRNEMLAETPSFFDGRWEEISSRLDLPVKHRIPAAPRRHEERRGRFIGALAVMLVLIGTTWLIDQRPIAIEGAIAAGPGLSVTELSVEGEKATVEIETATEEDGAHYLWLEPGGEGPEMPRDQR